MGLDIGKQRKIYLFLTALACICGVVWTVTNVGYDGEYQIALSYRLLQGDKMFLEMWEPHQTSALFSAALMWPYLKICRTTTGIVLYLQVCGILIRGGLALYLYRVLRAMLEKKTAFGMALLMFMISPKDYAMPEFSNLQLWFSVLLFCWLLLYLEEGKMRHLVFAAVCLCMEVLAYPSCAIVFVGVAVILIRYAAHKKRDVFLVTGICALLGAAFVGFFLVSMGPETFLECIQGMLSLEPTHTVSIFSKFFDYLKGIAQIGLVLLIVFAFGFLISQGVRRICRRVSCPFRGMWLLCSSIILLAGFFVNILSAEYRYAYSVILLFAAGTGVWNKNALEEREKRIYFCANLIGGLGFLATLLLTDLPFYVSVPYGLLAAAGALIPIQKKWDSTESPVLRKAFFFCGISFVLLLAVRCFLIRTPLTGKGQICSSFSGLGLVRTGPAKGLVSDEEGVCIQRDSYEEWKELIRPGDKVWIVGGVVDTLGYLYEDVEVAGPSTMSTPTYTEAVSEYWRLNPDKYPDVIIVEGYLGELSYDVKSSQWLMNFIFEEFKPQYTYEGKYWNYYFREQR